MAATPNDTAASGHARLRSGNFSVRTAPKDLVATGQSDCSSMTAAGHVANGAEAMFIMAAGAPRCHCRLPAAMREDDASNCSLQLH